MLEQQHVVVEPADHRGLEAGLVAQPGGQLSHVRAGAVEGPHLLRACGEVDRPGGGQRVAGGSTSTIGSAPSGMISRSGRRELDEVGRRDDDVHVAAAQRRPTLVRFGLEQHDVHAGATSASRATAGSARAYIALWNAPAARCRPARRPARAAPPRPPPSGQDLPARRASSTPVAGQPHPAPGAFQEPVRVSVSSMASCWDTVDGLRCRAGRRPGRCRGWRGGRAGATATGSAHDDCGLCGSA